MSPITHFLASWTLGDAVGCDRRDCALVTWCGVLPDADGLGVVVDAASRVFGRPEAWYYGIYHHSLLHGLPAAIVLPGVLSLLAVRRLRVFIVGFMAVHLHLLCDFVGSRGPAKDDIWPIQYLAPLSDAVSVSWSGQWALNGWPNVVATVLLLIWIFTRAIRMGYSPVGVLSSRGDQLFVETVRTRWALLRGSAKSRDLTNGRSRWSRSFACTVAPGKKMVVSCSSHLLIRWMAELRGHSWQMALRTKMRVIKFSSAERCEPEKDWRRVSLCNQENISIEHFVKPPGHASPRHEHPNAQVLIVLKGKLVITTDNDEQELCENDAVFIPGDETHTVTNPLKEPSVGIDIFVPGRSFDFWLKRMNR